MLSLVSNFPLDHQEQISQIRQIHTMLSFQDIEQNMSTVNEHFVNYTGCVILKMLRFH